MLGFHISGAPKDNVVHCAAGHMTTMCSTASPDLLAPCVILVAYSSCRLKHRRQRFMVTAAALCARSAITDTRAAAFRPLHLEPSSHHGAPSAPRMGTLALTEPAPPAAVPQAVARDKEEVLFEESPICQQPVRFISRPSAIQLRYADVDHSMTVPTNES